MGHAATWRPSPHRQRLFSAAPAWETGPEGHAAVIFPTPCLSSELLKQQVGAGAWRPCLHAQHSSTSASAPQRIWRQRNTNTRTVAACHEAMAFCGTQCCRQWMFSYSGRLSSHQIVISGPAGSERISWRHFQVLVRSCGRRCGVLT